MSAPLPPMILPPMILLCGGLGTRLRAVVNDRPKPMALIGERPFLVQLLDWYRRQGVPRFVLAAGFRGDNIQSYFAQDSDVDVLVEPSPLGTAGAVAAAWNALGVSEAGEVLVSNGDSFCAVDLAALVARRSQSQVPASMAVTERDASAEYGRVELDADGYILGFAEKSMPETSRMWINAGVYCFEGALLQRLPQPGSLERDVFPDLAAAGALVALKGQAEVLDIGTPERLVLAQQQLQGMMGHGFL